jgi:nucleoid-associated protein YgaU
MKNINITRLLVAFLAFVFVLGTVDTMAQKRRPTISKSSKRTAQNTDYKVDTGERIRVRMEDEINSKVSQVGDKFKTKVVEPVYSNTGVIVVPTGSTIVGEVDAVTQAKKGGDPGTISVNFIQLILPNGTTRSISGSLTSLDSKTAKSDNEGTASAKDRKNDKIIFIGGGTAGGAILGGIIGGGKGAVIGGIIGGIGGLIGERSTKGKDARVKSGTEFGVYINRPFYLPRYSANDPVIDNDRYEDDRREVPGNNPVSGRTYVVQPGDTLGKISLKFYGTSRRYMDIYNANRDRLASPNSVTVGQTLIIP